MKTSTNYWCKNCLLFDFMNCGTCPSGEFCFVWRCDAAETTKHINCKNHTFKLGFSMKTNQKNQEHYIVLLVWKKWMLYLQPSIFMLQKCLFLMLCWTSRSWCPSISVCFVFDKLTQKALNSRVTANSHMPNFCISGWKICVGKMNNLCINAASHSTTQVWREPFIAYTSLWEGFLGYFNLEATKNQ